VPVVFPAASTPVAETVAEREGGLGFGGGGGIWIGGGGTDTGMAY